MSQSLQCVWCFEFLGVVVNDTLTWSDHINIVSNITGAKLVYSGLAAGSHYPHTGGVPTMCAWQVGMMLNTTLNPLQPIKMNLYCMALKLKPHIANKH